MLRADRFGNIANVIGDDLARTVVLAEENTQPVYADHPAADAIVIGCTDCRAVEVIGALERKLGKPVITSNQALAFSNLTRISISPNSIESGGRLFKVRGPKSPPTTIRLL